MWPWLLSFIDIYTSDCLQQISKMAPMRTNYLTQITSEIVCNGELLLWSLCVMFIGFTWVITWYYQQSDTIVILIRLQLYKAMEH